MSNFKVHDSNGSPLLMAINENLRSSYEPLSIADLLKKRIVPDPFYQRKYVWAQDKASFFIESILKNSEIPPLILYRTPQHLEIIDGLQRYKTIRMFVNNEFKLNGGGLTTHRHMTGKKFDDLTEDQRRRFMSTCLRIYIYEFQGHCPNQETIERLLKQETFRRYNSGITSLTQLDIFKAKYLNDSLTHYLKQEMENDDNLKNQIASIFHLRYPKEESILNKVRQLLVLHYMPIHSFSYKKTGIHKIYDYYADLILESQGWEKILKSFVRKLKYIEEITELFNPNLPMPAGQAFECLFWALSVCQKQNYPTTRINTPDFKKKLARYMQRELSNAPSYEYARVGQYNHRFTSIASFFALSTDIDFDPYLKATETFKSQQEEITNAAIKKAEESTGKTNIFLKKDPITRSISSLIEIIQTNECSIRPPYQRQDVISTAKSSSIIESLLLGFRLPPIFLYTRKDGKSEVIDGQQRILSLLAFLGLSYTNEHGEKIFSRRNNFKLNLKGDGFLHGLQDKRFKDLDYELQQKIIDSQILIIEIKEENNQNFDPVDLFMRLNFKPYPIKDNSFESWNSFVDKMLTDQIKLINESNKKWFYYTKANERMQNEELITCLVYLEYMTKGERTNSWEKINTLLVTCMLLKRLHIRIYNKNAITRMLKDKALTDDLLSVCTNLKTSFLQKIRLLLNCHTEEELNDQLDELLFSNSEGKIRTNLRFYLLWVILSNISFESIELYSTGLIGSIKKVFNGIARLKRVEKLKDEISGIWKTDLAQRVDQYEPTLSYDGKTNEH